MGEFEEISFFSLFWAPDVLLSSKCYLAEKWRFSKSSQINGTRPVFYAKEDPVKIKIQKNLILEISSVKNGIHGKSCDWRKKSILP